MLAEESVCWLCDTEVDKTLGFMPGVHSKRCTDPECEGCVRHPMSPEVDEIIPVSKGGSPIERSNLHLAHRICNVRRGNALVPSTIPPPRQADPDLKTSRSW